MKTIFIVDDSESNRIVAKTALDDVYTTYALPSAARMFKLLEKIRPDLILLDIEMPEMGGFEALSILKSDEHLKNIPVVFLTAKNDEESEIRGFETGAIDFINKPFSPPVLIKRIETHIEIDKIVKQSLHSVLKAYNAVISNIADMVESRDESTGGHIARTQKYLLILVEEMLCSGVYADEASSWDLDILIPSAQLHDVGKIKISDAILNKPSEYTDEEYELIKRHCADGEHIIEKIINDAEDDRFLIHAKKFAGTHHEKWDGTGYPNGLSGENIPLEGRIMAIADVYDALVSERPYKMPFSHERAVKIILDGKGSHFDPLLINLFEKIQDKFQKAAAEVSLNE